MYGLLRTLNHHRGQQGLPPLKPDLRLALSARVKALDMARQGYFGHVSPQGVSPYGLLQALGIGFRWAGENLCRGRFSAEEAAARFLHSPRHRANVLHRYYTHAGAAWVPDGLKRLWVVHFIAAVAVDGASPAAATAGAPVEVDGQALEPEALPECLTRLVPLLERIVRYLDRYPPVMEYPG